MTSYLSNGCRIALRINLSTRWLAAFMIRTNKFRRRHLPSSSCLRTRHHTLQRVVRVATRPHVHLAVRSTSGAHYHPRQVEVSSCSTAVENLPASTATVDSDKIVPRWPRASRTVSKVRSLGMDRVLAATQISHRIRQIKNPCPSIRTLQRRTLQHSNLWWPPQAVLIISLVQDRTCFIPGRKRAVHKIPPQEPTMKSQNNRRMEIKFSVRQLLEDPLKSPLVMQRSLEFNKLLCSRNNRSVRHRSRLEVPSSGDKKQTMGWSISRTLIHNYTPLQDSNSLLIIANASVAQVTLVIRTLEHRIGLLSQSRMRTCPSSSTHRESLSNNKPLRSSTKR